MSLPVAAFRQRSSAAVDRWFQIDARGSTVGREVRGGVVTFFTMAYIVVLNPLIIGTQPDGTGVFLGGGSAPDLPAVAAATALVAGVLTIAMGAVANFPLALATGLGINAFLTFGVAQLPGMTWADAMGLVVIEGLIVLVLVLTGLREAVFRAVPRQLKTAISVGIGLFIALVGLVDAGIVRRTSAGPVPVELGVGGELLGWPTVVFLVGLLVIIALMARRQRSAILVGLLTATSLALVVEAVLDLGPATEDSRGWSLAVPRLPETVVELPDLGLLGQFDLLGSFQAVGVVTVVLLVFSLLLADFFDTLGTMVAVGAGAELLDEQGTPPATRRILVVDSVAAVAGGAASVSSATSYIESATGVAEGARTGLASIVTGTLFLVAMFFSPLVVLVPYEAAAPALVVVGYLIMTQVGTIDWNDIEVALPAFLTIVLMPFAYSITVGIGAGFVSFVVLKLVVGKASAVHPLMWATAGVFVLYFGRGPLAAALGV